MYSSSYTIKLKITYLIKFHSYSYSLSTINYNQIGTTIVYKKIVLLSSSNVVIVELASSSSKFQYRQILEQLLFSSAISLDSDTTFIYRVSEYLLKVYPVIMLILGVFGNALSFCVLIRQSMRRYSTFCYLACLALVDIGVILTFCINFILLYHLKYDMQEKAFACKLFAFCTYFLPQYSSWLLVAVSFDRVISAKYLKLAKTWTRPKQSLVIMIALGLILALINIHFFFYKNYSIQLPTKIITTTLSNINGNRSVSYEPQLAHFSDDQTSFSYDSLSFTEAVPDTGQLKSYYADTTMASVLPIKSSPNIIVIDDTFKIPDVNIIHCSLENDPRLEWLYPYWAWIDLLMNVIIPFTAMIACTVAIILTILRSSQKSGSTSASRSRRRRNISVMLVTVNLVFISLTAPIVIYLSAYDQLKNEKNYYRSVILRLIKIFCIILMNLNHSINIVIYSVTAKEFRTEMTNFLHAVLYSIIGGGPNEQHLNYYDDGNLVSRLRTIRHSIFNCCSLKVRVYSSNATESSKTNQHNNNNSSNYQSVRKKGPRRSRCDSTEREHIVRTSDGACIANKSHRLTVQLQQNEMSSVYEKEISFRGLSNSTED